VRLDGQVVIVTGAGRGIGAETARLLTEAGARVAVVDRSGAEASADALTATGAEALAVEADVSRAVDMARMAEAVLARWGRIDVLVNNAGITADARVSKLTEEAFARVLDVNLKGVLLATQAVLPAMRAQGRGKLINAASTVGLHGNFGQTNYAAAKGGVIAMTKTWAKELGPEGITANAVAPGFVLTEMTATVPAKVLEAARERTPLRRLGEPLDLARVYMFLASPLADFVNGQVITVDGGMSL
jgi:3-oxoacyl-[acyl-carrier protein] reductase